MIFYLSTHYLIRGILIYIYCLEDINAWRQIVNSAKLNQKTLRQQKAINRQLNACSVCMKVSGFRIGLF